MPKKIIKSLKYARAGAEYALRTQRNLWVHFFAALFIVALAVYFGLSQLELAVLVLAAFGVIAAEMFNTAVEELVNFVSPQESQTAALVKNLAAAAVLVAAVGAVIIGGIIFIPKVV